MAKSKYTNKDLKIIKLEVSSLDAVIEVNYNLIQYQSCTFTATIHLFFNGKFVIETTCPYNLH